jgi:formate hydrogenlyase subunit 3/multisubunit Na+/H+ antiporter MnhD subunit
VLGLLGAMALTAFLIGFIADVLLGGNYWLAALIVGAIFTAIGGFLTRGAIARARARRFRSKAVVEAVREDPRVPPEIKVEAARDRFAVRP